MRAFIFTVLLILLAALQTTLAVHLKLFGVLPNLMLAFVVCIALIEGTESGIVFGLVAGVVLDVLGNGLFGFHGITMMYTGLLCGIFSSHFFRRNAIAVFMFTFLASVLSGLTFYVFHFLVWGNKYFLFAVGTKILPEALYSALVAVPLHLFLMRVKGLRICSGR